MSKTNNNITGKIVVVGMQRTGTTTLGEALYILGYKVIGTPSTSTDVINGLLNYDEKPAILKAKFYDAFQDLPWLNLYKGLDIAFPGSKFILTLRDEKSWIASMLDHFSNTDTKMRQWAYGAGCPTGNEQLYLNKFRKHYDEVLDYFKERPSDLLIMNLSNGDGWEKLCKFLDKKIPNKNFPHTNKRKQNYTFFENIKSFIRNTMPVEKRLKIYKFFGIKSKRNKFHTLN